MTYVKSLSCLAPTPCMLRLYDERLQKAVTWPQRIFMYWGLTFTDLCGPTFLPLISSQYLPSRAPPSRPTGPPSSLCHALRPAHSAQMITASLPDSGETLTFLRPSLNTVSSREVLPLPSPGELAAPSPSVSSFYGQPTHSQVNIYLFTALSC